MVWEIILLFKMTRTVLKLGFHSNSCMSMHGRQSEYIPGISFLITGKEGGGGSYYQITVSRTLTFQLRNS